MDRALFAADALLETGWTRNVRFEWDERGTLTVIQPGAVARGARIAKGPVLPGMANVHSHAFQRAMAGLAEVRGHENDDFWTWRKAMYRLVASLTADEVEAIALQLYVELLKHGYTAVAEFHYLHHGPGGTPYGDPAELSLRIVSAATDAGIGLTLLPALYAHGGFDHRALDAAQRRFAGSAESIGRLLEKLAAGPFRDPRLRLGVAPHSARAVDAGMLAEVIAALRRVAPDGPIHMHVSEQAGEVRECIAAHGVAPGRWLMDNAPVDRRWCLVHGTHLAPDELRQVRAAGAVIGLCPTTEANLGDGIFPFDVHFASGGRFAVGGDSHVSVSPFAELRALECSQRLVLRLRNVSASPGHPDVAANLWAGAAQGGMLALGEDARFLCLGCRADFVVLDGADLDFAGLEAPAMLSAAMFCGERNRVREVFVRGTPVVTDGHHARETDAAAGFRKAVSRLRAAAA
jgi:formimidoylglutamate deiminase